MQIKLVPDRDKFESPPCVIQNDRLRSLACCAMEAGEENAFQVRALKPSKYGPGGFNSQHSKTWIIDEEIYNDGSASLTGQSAKNQGSILITRDASVVSAATATFLEVWSESEEVSAARLRELPEYRGGSRSRSFSLRRSHSVSAKRE